MAVVLQFFHKINITKKIIILTYLYKNQTPNCQQRLGNQLIPLSCAIWLETVHPMEWNVTRSILQSLQQFLRFAKSELNSVSGNTNRNILMVFITWKLILTLLIAYVNIKIKIMQSKLHETIILCFWAVGYVHVYYNITVPAANVLKWIKFRTWIKLTKT